ncbi:MAG: tRNA 2-thiouridine(34) synthase MnmA [Bacteroidales bacterium]|jgi:tRNA-specific 2-thiouridylase|nr:tRNA 2-thiouridine(34) synthase MnmA [Bacteroidales bacterium]
MNIAALVSGGVDSSVVVHRLKEAGLSPTIFYIRIGMQTEDGFMDCPSEEDIEITTFIARKYGLSFEVVPLHKEYWDTVVAYTIDTVKRGLTPNPDVMCNKLIKFGVFEERYGKDFDRIATGHYARTAVIQDKVYLATAADRVKDQTYFLAELGTLQVSRLMFPIGDLQKSEVRAIAAQQNLPSATRKDSQGICFLGKINYNDFIRRYLGVKKGNIIDIDTGKILGQHNGFWYHTIGQRKGLGLSGGPWYVIDKNTDENILFVARGHDTPAQYGTVVKIRGLRYITCPPPDVAALSSPATSSVGGGGAVPSAAVPSVAVPSASVAAPAVAVPAAAVPAASAAAPAVATVLSAVAAVPSAAVALPSVATVPPLPIATVPLVASADIVPPPSCVSSPAVPITFKIRHTPEFTNGTIRQDGDHWVIESEKPLQGIASGQFAVIYDQSCHLCLASGIIA